MCDHFSSQLYGNAKSAKLDRFSVELLNKVAIIQGIGGRGLLRNSGNDDAEGIGQRGFRGAPSRGRIFSLPMRDGHPLGSDKFADRGNMTLRRKGFVF